MNGSEFSMLLVIAGTLIVRAEKHAMSSVLILDTISLMSKLSVFLARNLPDHVTSLLACSE
jgi:hypothetical protein